MTFEYYEGSVFECAEINGVDMVVNTVNCKGFMGAGLALEFKLRYPHMFENYKQKCAEGSIKIGTLDMYDKGDLKILNFPTKDDWKKPSNIDWIKQGLLYFYNNYKKYEVKSIAFPKLGTSNGGLDWGEVKDLMERCFAATKEIKIYICLDNSVPKGTEGKMLSILNNVTIEELKQIGIRSSGIENFNENVPFERFFFVSKVKGLGAISYERLHTYCLQKVNQNNYAEKEKEHSHQLSMFDNI